MRVSSLPFVLRQAAVLSRIILLRLGSWQVGLHLLGDLLVFALVALVMLALVVATVQVQVFWQLELGLWALQSDRTSLILRPVHHRGRWNSGRTNSDVPPYTANMRRCLQIPNKGCG